MCVSILLPEEEDVAIHIAFPSLKTGRKLEFIPFPYTTLFRSILILLIISLRTAPHPPNYSPWSSNGSELPSYSPTLLPLRKEPLLLLLPLRKERLLSLLPSRHT